MSLSLRSTREDIPECQALGVVDLTSLELLGSSVEGEAAAQALDRLRGGADVLLDSDDARVVAAILDRACGRDHDGDRETDGEGAARDVAFQQVVVRAGDGAHVIQRRDEGTSAGLMVCAAVTNLGRILAEARCLSASTGGFDALGE